MRILNFLMLLFTFNIIFFSSLFSTIYNLDFYDRKFEQYGVYNIFSEQEALGAAQNIMDFFKSQAELDNEFFNEREISHLVDVRNLINLGSSLYYLSIAVFWALLIIIYILSKKQLVNFFSGTLFYSWMAGLALLVLITVLYFTAGFDWLFIKFHELFFTGNYSFNPAVSNLKALFPDEFFRDMAVKIVALVGIKSFLTGATGFIIRRSTF